MGDAAGRPRLRREVAFAAVAFAFAVTMMGTTLPTPLYPLYQEKIGFSELMVTIVFAVYAFAVIAGLLLFGAASDQLGRRRALLPGLALSAASAVAFLLVGGLAELFLGRVLSGLSAGLFTGTATATLVDLAAPEARRRATLVATAANIGGLGLGPLVCGLLAEYRPGSAPARLLRRPGPDRDRGGAHLPDPRDRRRPTGRAPAPPAARRPGGGASDLRPGCAGGLRRLRDPRPVHGRGAGIPRPDSGRDLHAVLGIVVAVAFESSLLGQLAVDRVGEERSLPLGCASMIAGMALLIGGLEAESLALIVLGGICAGIGQGLSFRAGLAAMNRDAPSERRAETVSSYFVVAYAALAVPVIGVGIAADAWDLRGAGVAFAVIMAAIAAAVLISLRAGARPKPAG